MTAVLRPDGDDIAAVYGPYKTKKEMKKIAKGDKLELLCSDGLNYHVEVKETGTIGRLHFRNWSVKYDYVGSFDQLYLATQGAYSEGITPQNTYSNLFKAENSGEKSKVIHSTKSTSNNPGTDSRPQNFPSGTRYPEDFLSKPRFASSHSRKRAAEELKDPDPKKKMKETAETKISPLHEKTTVIPDQNIADEAFDKTPVISNDIDGKSMVTHDRQDKSDNRHKKFPGKKKLPTPKKFLQELSSVDGITTDAGDQIDVMQNYDDAVKSSPETKAEPESAAAVDSEENKEEVSGVVEEVLSSSAASAHPQPENKISTAASNCEFTSVVQQVSRAIPAHQIETQRAAQIKFLREMLAVDKAITDTGRAIDTITNHPIVFHSENSSTQYSAQQLLSLLQARRKIDEVIHHMLGAL